MDHRRRPPVKRCLFGRPTDSDTEEFQQTVMRLKEQEEERFVRRWNLDGVEDQVVWTRAERADIPEFYSKPYPHMCKRRAVRPCVGKTLSFCSPDDADMDEVVRRDSTPAAAVKYDAYSGTSAVEVYIGLLAHHQPPQEQVTPKKHDRFEDSLTSMTISESSTNSLSDDSPSSPDAVPPASFSSRFLRKKLTQRRLTDMWRVLKSRRQRSLTCGQRLPKRARIDRL